MGHNIGYHTRLISDNTTKVVGGSFGGAVDMQTVERLVKAHFTVKVMPSGRPVFVDRHGREVSLYFTIDAGETDAGKAALAADREARRKQAESDAEREEAEERERAEIMSGLTHQEIMRRLSGK